MKLRYFAIIAILASGIAIVTAQNTSQNNGISAVISKGDRTRIAVPDFRGKGPAEPLMATFNDTVWNDLADAGVLDLVAKTNYPTDAPQSPADFRVATPGQVTQNGMRMADWANAPVNTNYLGIGYADGASGNLILQGHLLNVGLADPQAAQMFSKPYFGTLDQEGARRVAHEYAADILKNMGALSLAGSKIYFISNRSGSKQVWAMDYDGQNQQRMSNEGGITKMPAVSADGKQVAYATMVTGKEAGWQIRVVNAETRRQQTFLNPTPTTITSPEFSLDGKRLWFSMAIDDGVNRWLQIVSANIDGSDRRRVTQTRATEVEPRLNPKTSAEVLFISGRTGRPQLYKMNADGSNAEMITTGEGDVANPSWSPDGKMIAFAWTRGYEPGNFNIFVMDMAKREPVQLTRQNGSNENPYWAPDGVHLVYSNQKGRSVQIFTMLADGTRVKQLTTQGDNVQPVWAAKTN
jgi:TolB protein